jgi:hypothetical protein
VNAELSGLRGRAVFLSASIPNSSRWDGPFDPLEITDAVVACARAVWNAGGLIVTAAHPTIAPLLWYTASEIEPRDHPIVIIYQSEVFAGSLPEATVRFEAHAVARVIRVPAAAGESIPDPVFAPRSLADLRIRMLTTESPVAAIFIGGMAGIAQEEELFAQLHPLAPRFAFGAPGGAAASLVSVSPQHLRSSLHSQRVYPTLARALVDHIIDR